VVRKGAEKKKGRGGGSSKRSYFEIRSFATIPPEESVGFGSDSQILSPYAPMMLRLKVGGSSWNEYAISTFESWVLRAVGESVWGTRLADLFLLTFWIVVIFFLLGRSYVLDDGWEKAVDSLRAQG